MEGKVCNWDPLSCQSLLGYGRAAHERSGGVCAYCGLGSDGVTFDLWRQLTVDHVIASNTIGPGGLGKLIRAKCFPNLPEGELKKLFESINRINLVTACSFCNSMTSRKRTRSIHEIMPDEPSEEVVAADHPLVEALLSRLEQLVDVERKDKVKYVQARLDTLKEYFDGQIVRVLVSLPGKIPGGMGGS